MVYLPMSYIYGKRFTGPITNTVKALREEIFIQPYSKIDWNKARNECAKVSLKLFFFNSKSPSTFCLASEAGEKGYMSNNKHEQFVRFEFFF